MWDVRARRSEAAFLGEMYRNADDWDEKLSIKEWVLLILMQLSSSVGSIQQCKLETKCDMNCSAVRYIELTMRCIYTD